MKTVCLCAAKGGVGKTTLSINLASILASRGSRVLLIDFDDQCNASFDLGIRFEDLTDASRSSSVLLDEDADDETVYSLIRKAPIPALPSLDLIPASFSLVMTERLLSYSAFRSGKVVNGMPCGSNEARLLKYAITEYADIFSAYDYVIFDTKPSMTHINENVFYASDSMIAVTDPSYNGVMGLATMISFWTVARQNLGIGDTDENMCIVMNRFRKNLSVDNAFLALFRGERPALLDSSFLDRVSYFSGYFIEPVIRESVSLKLRSVRSLPLVVNTEYREKDVLAMLDALIDSLCAGGLL